MFGYLLVRDRNNRFDANALRAVNSSKEQVGNIPTEISNILSPLIDERRVKVEATVAGSTANKIIIPISIHMHGPPEDEEDVLEYCYNGGIFVKTKQVLAELAHGQPPLST